MGAEPSWLKADEVEYLHSRLAPSAKLADQGLLENAVAAPLMTWTYDESADLFDLGLRLLESVARGHAFSDGNKRVGFYAMGVFLRRNGAIFAAPDTEEVGEWIVGMVERRITMRELDDFLRPYVVLPK